ncbi:MAG: leucyl aminopeptidase, partial [Actinomycetota bacterium]
AVAIDKALDGAVSAHLRAIRFRGEVSGAVVRFTGAAGMNTTLPTMGRIPASTVMVVGLGKPDEVDHDRVRRAAGVVARQSGGYQTVALDLADGVRGGAPATVEGFVLGSNWFSRYRSKAEDSRVDRLIVLGRGDGDIKRARTVAEATNWARDLINEPAGDRGPAEFADQVKARARGAGVDVQVLDEKELSRRGMNGILGVGQGSARPPRLVLLSYRPRSRGLLGVIGKGITFDSGGLSLKPAEGMETMKTDCSGAAAVAAAVCALPALNPKVAVKAAIPLADNMPSGNAIKPGDVIRHYGGRTAEVLNTDAEGRLVLADALAYMAEQKPDAMVDLATLTGGMMVALGRKTAGFFANREPLAAELLAASRRTGERLWQMPLLDELRVEIDSELADIKNTGGRYGSPIFGALFLRDFVGEVPWAHLDIAGPARSEKLEHYLPKGATGYGTRLLVDWIENRAARKPR